MREPIAPMLAKLSDDIPEGDGWLYEPKWDGFRCIVVRDGDTVELTSRNERPFTRYFPELLGPLRDQLPDGCVIDGEIVLPAADDRGLDFDALLQRIHPAESRVRRLSAETPASFVAFDLLGEGGRDLMNEPLSVRHARLEALMAGATAPLHMCPSTTDHQQASRWFVECEGAGLDGVVAKRLSDPYTPDKRTMVKVKHRRTADCVIAGYRVHKDGKGVGSLLLGLYDETGRLHHVGVAASFTVKRRAELMVELEPLTHDALDGHPWREWAEWMQQATEGGQRMPGGGSRWNAGKDLGWVPLRVERVAEVTFGQLQEGRFRHGSQFLRWRTDREPSSCTYSQLEVATPVPFSRLVGG
ncbi:MAG TPA: ATP-dependent DNA ligase [Ilumatobacteraceae bacterium]|nr:ATP-dependent DNA ligase [Ilumatobacteraceae bacterium]